MRTFAPSSNLLDNKKILVTGGTGSFGKAFVRFVLQNYKPAKLIVFSRDEFKQYEMSQEFSPEKYPCMRYFIGDVRDVDRLEMAFRDVDIVVHAAAIKHVTVAEYNPFECIATNVIGAQNIVKAAINQKVKRVIALSTDKAVNPVNLYGASKLAADKIFVASNAMSGTQDTKFSVVRYGNVVGSRGSVVPLFKKLINEKSPFLPITDAAMTRFWITLEQGVNFTISSLDLMKGGEVFVPKIPSMCMVDLASAMAPELEQKIVGIRPGEKIHEILISEDESRNTIDIGDRYIVYPNISNIISEKSLAKGKKVAEDFHYASNNNDEWLNKEQLIDFIK
ncbi:MAG: UDP-N-acetylglucosamine 4,6-dehydratase (inverting) [Alphaproteobacteria bacterium]